MTTTVLQRDLRDSIEPLLRWVGENGWDGWDPYDVWDSWLGAWAGARSSFSRRAAGALLSRTHERAPVLLRRALGVRRAVNPKAMGLFADALLTMERLDGGPEAMHPRREHRPSYEECFSWLETHAARNPGMGWGYPFDWHTRVTIPRGTPTVVNSAIVGNAFWNRYRTLGSVADLEVCESVCRFILDGLQRTPGAQGTFCFSYTPVDSFQVHNANLFGAEFLARIGRETDKEEWVALASRAGHFSLREIRADGTLNYWSNAQARGLQQDTYHSGFEIRALLGLGHATGEAAFTAAATRYFETWCRDFFTDGRPGFVRGLSDVVESHSCAEAFLCATAAHRAGIMDADAYRTHTRRCLDTLREALWVEQAGGKAFIAWRARWRHGSWRRVEIPFIRWAQAWSLNALSTALAACRDIQVAATRHDENR